MSKLIFLSDVDGVMNTGRFFYTTEGKVMKEFGSDDADALNLLSKFMDIHFVSGDKRGFPITKKRIEDDMGFRLDMVSTFDRLSWIREKYPLQDVVYMGDGIFDGLVFPHVGYSIAPGNSFPETKRRAKFVTEAVGGDGAVAEAVVHLMEKFFGGFNLEQLDLSKGIGLWTATGPKNMYERT